jgi:hypothetical protein
LLGDVVSQRRFLVAALVLLYIVKKNATFAIEPTSTVGDCGISTEEEKECERERKKENDREKERRDRYIEGERMRERGEREVR